MIPYHPLANLFPMMAPHERAELVADMRANGFRPGEEIVLLDGQILDGRNRYEAAIEAGVFPPDVDPAARREFVEFSPSWTSGERLRSGPLDYVLAKNLHRRHLNESQRAFVAAKLANLGECRPPSAAQICAVSQTEAAETLAVSRRSVQHASHVQVHGAPELQRVVETGKLSVSQAALACRLAQDRQEAIAREAEAGRLNVVRDAIKQDLRAARERELAARVEALPQRRYGVIVADPEWRFEVWSEAGLDRAADNHYPTSPTEAIAARDVPSIAADDCVLFLWATVPMLPQALAVMTAWGFGYRSHQVWRKDRVGTGYWFRNQHELVLVGVRGNVPAPAPGTNVPSIFEAPVGAHSAKPDCVLELIDRWYPHLPKVELNRRGPARPGWDAWGNEAAVPAAPAPSPDHFGGGNKMVSTPAAACDLPDLPEFLRRESPSEVSS